MPTNTLITFLLTCPLEKEHEHVKISMSQFSSINKF